MMTRRFLLVLFGFAAILYGRDSLAQGARSNHELTWFQRLWFEYEFVDRLTPN
jgi:hypothetical protein